MASTHLTCDICHGRIAAHGHYLVRIEVYADPSVPEMTAEEVEELDFEATMKQLMEEMKGFSAEELMDQVHRRFDYRICRGCQAKFIANPLGLPRGEPDGGDRAN